MSQSVKGSWNKLPVASYRRFFMPRKPLARRCPAEQSILLGVGDGLTIANPLQTRLQAFKRSMIAGQGEGARSAPRTAPLDLSLGHLRNGRAGNACFKSFSRCLSEWFSQKLIPAQVAACRGLDRFTLKDLQRYAKPS